MPSIPQAADGELITYRTDAGFCIGECATSELLVSSDGQAVLRLHRRVGYHYREDEVRTRRLHVTPDQLADFRAELERVRPKGELALDNVPPCTSLVSDAEEYDVHWRSNGREDHLVFNVGCEAVGSDEIWKALGVAPALLGLRNLPGVSRPNLPER